jgi:hypothetical protein
MFADYGRTTESCPEFPATFEPTLALDELATLRNAAALIVDEAPETFGYHQGRRSQLEDLYVASRNEQIECAAANAGKAACIIHTHADRLDADMAASSILYCFDSSRGHRMQSKPQGQ